MSGGCCNLSVNRRSEIEAEILYKSLVKLRQARRVYFPMQRLIDDADDIDLSSFVMNFTVSAAIEEMAVARIDSAELTLVTRTVQVIVLRQTCEDTI